MSETTGRRLEVRIDEVLFRDSEDPFEPRWAIAVQSNGKSYLLYGVRHKIAPQVGMRAIMECHADGHWVLVEAIA